MDIKKEPISNVGVIVGRFQVNELHKAHIDLIQFVVNRHKKVIIFLGTTPLKCTYNNPLDFESRKQMILQRFPNIIVLYITDKPCDVAWSRSLDEKISDVVSPNQTVSLYGSRDSFVLRYHGKYNCIKLNQESNISGTQTRNEISNLVIPSKDFRSGVIWAAMNRYINPVICVDVAIFNDDRSKLLLAKKKHEKKLRFIGGHVDRGENLETTVRREVNEESGLEIGTIEYVGSFAIDDWRYKGENNNIVTTLFKTNVTYGKETPNDDITHLEWVDININPDLIVHEHVPLFLALQLNMKGTSNGF